MEIPVKITFSRINLNVLQRETADYDLAALVKEELEPIKNIKEEKNADKRTD